MPWKTEATVETTIVADCNQVMGDEVANVKIDNRETTIIYDERVRAFWFAHSSGAVGFMLLDELFARVASDLNYFASVQPGKGIPDAKIKDVSDTAPSDTILRKGGAAPDAD